MRVYELTYKTLGQVPPSADASPEAVPMRTAIKVREWFPSEREAVIRRLDLFKRGLMLGKKSDAVIEAVDVPTDKRGLLAFLNEEAV